MPPPRQSEALPQASPATAAPSQEVPERRLGANIPELKFVPFSESVTENKPKQASAESDPPKTAVRRNPGADAAVPPRFKRLADKPIPVAAARAPQRKPAPSIPWIGMAAAFIILMVVGALLSRRTDPAVSAGGSRDIRNVRRAALDPYHPEALPLAVAAPLLPAASASSNPGPAVVLLRGPIPAPLAPPDSSR